MAMLSKMFNATPKSASLQRLSIIQHPIHTYSSFNTNYLALAIRNRAKTPIPSKVPPIVYKKEGTAYYSFIKLNYSIQAAKAWHTRAYTDALQAKGLQKGGLEQITL